VIKVFSGYAITLKFSGKILSALAVLSNMKNGWEVQVKIPGEFLWDDG